MFYFKLSLLLLLFTFLRIKAFNFPKDNHIINARNSFNISSESDQRWLLKAATPSYLQDFLNVIKTDSKYTEILQNNLFHGVSYTCSQHVEQWLIKLTNPTWDNLATDRNKWVLQLIDAWGKIPEGILSGHINSFGDFDECIQVEVKNLPILDTSVSRKFDGLYCTSYILDYATAMEVTPVPISSMQETVKEENSVQKSLSLEELLQLMFGLKPFGAMPLIPSVGVCFPNSCSQLDVQQLLVNGLVQVYSQSPDANFTALPWPVTISCTDRHKPSPDAGTIATLVILGILIGLALAAGVLDYWNQNYPSNSNSSLTSSKHYQYLMAFSIYSNTIKLVSTRRSPEDLGCLHGIRFLSTAWVVLAHTYVMFIGGPQWNLIDLNEVYKHWPEMTVINGSFSVDTFFMMSGMLATYNLLKVLDKQKGRINMPMIYLHRYIRLTPTYMILIAIFTTLTTYTGNGPFWFVWKVLEDGCRKNWWTNIIYLNNIVNAKEYCNGETWYLANDMQFFVLSPLIIYPLWKWEKIGVSLLAFYSVLSWTGPILVHRFATDAPAAPVFTRV